MDNYNWEELFKIKMNHKINNIYLILAESSIHFMDLTEPGFNLVAA